MAGDRVPPVRRSSLRLHPVFDIVGHRGRRALANPRKRDPARGTLASLAIVTVLTSRCRSCCPGWRTTPSCDKLQQATPTSPPRSCQRCHLALAHSIGAALADPPCVVRVVIMLVCPGAVCDVADGCSARSGSTGSHGTPVRIIMVLIGVGSLALRCSRWPSWRRWSTSGRCSPSSWSPPGSSSQCRTPAPTCRGASRRRSCPGCRRCRSRPVYALMLNLTCADPAAVCGVDGPGIAVSVLLRLPVFLVRWSRAAELAEDAPG